MSDAATGTERPYNDRVASVIAEELEELLERFDELEDLGVSEGYRALEHKIQEARGPLASAAAAMRQYETGEKKPADG